MNEYQPNSQRDSPFNILLSSVGARFFCIMLTFPIEYRMTILMGQAKYTTKIDKKYNQKITTGLSDILMRELLIAVTFWQIYEFFWKWGIKARIGHFDESQGKEGGVLLTLGASTIATAVCSVVTFPLELSRTLKVSYEMKYGHLSTIQVVQKVMNMKKGSSLIYSGLVAHAWRVMGMNFVFFFWYENFKESIRKKAHK